MNRLLRAITQTDNLERAYQWLCKRRKDYSANSDVWRLRSDWHTQRTLMVDSILNGSYQFEPVNLYLIEGLVRAVWSARDALLLRAITQVLKQHLNIHSSCLHHAGNGGVHEGLRWVNTQRKQYRYLFRSDVKGYYRHIRHGVVLRQLKQTIHEPRLMHLLRRYLHRVETRGGVYCSKHQGLKGDPLAPLLGALYLKRLDIALSKLGEYRRFMDDWIILTNDKRRLRQAINTTHRILKKLGMVVHPDKTFAGLSQHPFHFLGIQFDAAQLSIPWQRLLTIKNTIAAQSNDSGIRKYRKNSLRWYKSVSNALSERVYVPLGVFAGGVSVTA